MGATITKYNAVCNLGSDINTIFQNAIAGNDTCFRISADIIRGKSVRLGRAEFPLPEINEEDYNIRCNRLLLKALSNPDIESLILKYGRENIAVVCATTNTGVDEYASTKNPMHAKISNPAEFIRYKYGLKNFITSVSTACSSGIKAFTIAEGLLETDTAKAVIVAGTDAVSRVPIFGFDSLEILSGEPSDPFGRHRHGINLGEASAVFFVEKDADGIEILSTSETTDSYHSTTPDPEAGEAVKAIRTALEKAGLKAKDIDYINLHGTGTKANDLMEAKAVYDVFGAQTPASSTKPLTGHCLGSAGSIETALCCKLLESFDGRIFPHKYSGDYDPDIAGINISQTRVDKLDTVLSTSFGFGGTNTAIILRKARNV